jgi:hypothetical protein
MTPDQILQWRKFFEKEIEVALAWHERHKSFMYEAPATATAEDCAFLWSIKVRADDDLC